MTSGNGQLPRFDDGKASDALRTIGEVARAFGIQQHVLRYWEEQFPTLRPIKRSGGRRYFRPEDIRLIDRINRLVHQQGYTLRGARKVIEQGHDDAQAIQAASSEPTKPEQPLLSELRAIRHCLAKALAAA